MGKTSKGFALGAVLAAVVGYAAGILTAPKSGRQTRDDIKEAASRKLSEAEKQLKKMQTQADELLAEAKNKASSLRGQAVESFDTAVEKAKQARGKVSEMLSRSQEGETASDEDLKKAIDEAQHAIDDLKIFLSKKS